MVITALRKSIYNIKYFDIQALDVTTQKEVEDLVNSKIAENAPKDGFPIGHTEIYGNGGDRDYYYWQCCQEYDPKNPGCIYF